MKRRLGALALALLLPTCADRDGTNNPPAPIETSRSALGTPPASEIATWTRVAGGSSPDPRVGQALAYDSNRKLVMVFGGAAALSGDTPTVRQDVWEWNPATGAWRDRSPTGVMPDARSEAAVVYDSVRDKLILFGGRAPSGLDYQDTWEWNPADGTWTERTGAGQTPDARARHAMVYDPKRKLAVLFGGGRSVQGTAASSATDVAAITTAFASTWEYEPVSAAWTDRTPASAAASPSARYDAGMVWDSKRNVAVLFGGLQKKAASVDGSPKQDTWDWNGEAGTWTERTLAGSKPSARFGHGMAYDPGRSKVVVFGGYDINTGETQDDLWDWEPGTGTWTERSAASATVPSARIWASLVLLTDNSPARMELFAGSITATSMGGAGAESSGSAGPSLLDEVWDLDPAAGTWTGRSFGVIGPSARFGHAMATDLDTGKVYMFGGNDAASVPLNDLWVWDGTAWSQCKTASTPPSSRSDAAMAYDPVRKSLIVFGGTDDLSHSSPTGVSPSLGDTWEWNIAQATWTGLKVVGAPPGRLGAVMVTDAKRGRIIMVGGGNWGRLPSWIDSPDSQSALLSDVWEWNGSTLTWTDVTPPVGAPGPQMLSPAVAIWDTSRSKLVAMDNNSSFQFFEWDPYSHAWASTSYLVSGQPAPSSGVTFDSARRRMVALGDNSSTLELDTAAGQWFSRAEPVALQQRNLAALAYDNKRAVVVLFGGSGNGGNARDDTWEYKVTGLGNGTGCSSDFASRCASGNCVDGVCCESATCAGACRACNVAGKLGTCSAVTPGMEVAGSCSGQTACDGTGKCKAANGSTCTSGTNCASGFCADGVCCDSACKGICVSCNLPDRVGTCSPYQAGSDPAKECSAGTSPCQSSCDGLGECAFPTATCGQCGRCNGSGTCTENYYYPHCSGSSGSGGSGSGGSSGPGGSGGSGFGGSSGVGAGGSGSGGSSGVGAGGVIGSEDAGDLDGSAGMGGRGGRGGSGPVDAGSGGTAGMGGSAGFGGVDGGSSLLTGGTSASILDGGIVTRDGGGLLPDGGGVSSPSDAGLDGGRVDVRIGVGRANGSCSCDLGNTSSSHTGTGSMLLLGGLTWLARRAGKRRRRGAALGALALALLLPTCAAQDGPDSPATSVETARSALGTNPSSEIATWTRVAGTNSPDPRVGQSVAYDSNRKLVMVFGGAAAQSGDRQSLRQDVWEWNPATAAWRDRTPAGLGPDARSEAAVVYDSVRDTFILFGGRAGGGSNFEDTWEWNPTDGTWTDKTGAGQTPDARARHSMVYDVKRKVAVLFGGGRSIQGTTAATSTDVAAITNAFASTWEYEPVSAAWTDRTPASAAASPSARYDAGMVWDGNRNLLVLFGGAQDAKAGGALKQDTWEWNGEAGTWTERTVAGSKPSARFGHGMAYDPGRSKVVLFGGCDDSAGATKNDLWDWEPGAGTWTERVVPTTVPSARVWASLVLVTALLTDSSPVRMELFAGSATAVSMGGAGTGADPNVIPVSSLLNEVWDLTPAPGTWNQQPAGTARGPDARSRHAMATDLDTGKVYVFGGEDAAATPMNDLWVWDGAAWSQCKTTSTPPPSRADAGMAYDPARKSLIVFGGRDAPLGASPALSDTWEWNIAQATWTELKVVGAPPGRSGAAMVTDVKRNRIIMASGTDYSRHSPQNVDLTDVWEWNGTTLTWTDVSPPVGWGGPQIPIAAWDTARSKLVAMEGESGPEYYEWDPSSHAWAPTAITDKIVPSSAATFDSTRRRMVALGRSYGADPTGLMTFTLELDTTSKQWFARPLPVELQQHNMSVMAYDNKRAVVVLFGGVGNTGGVRGDTWEYKVTGLGNGTGCSSDFASQCASGNCVEGVCCESATCAGPCQSCNVAGNLGTCTAAAAGTQVAGSCSGQTACDGTGKCAAANGTACTSGAACASGFCSDGVCCDSACQGTCVSCNLPGRVGTCSPYQAGSDPEKECSKGTPPCQSSCDGLGNCAFPTITCGQCGQCNGYGTCIENYYYPSCIGVGGVGGNGGSGGGGGAGGFGGSGGSAGSSGAGGFGGPNGSAGFGGSSGVVILGGAGGLAGSASIGGRGGSGGIGLVDGGSDGAAGAGDTAGRGGLDGSSGPVTAGTGGSTYDGGLVPVDGSGSVRDGGSSASPDAKLGGGVDAPLVVRLQRGGCSCDLGNPSSPSGAMILLGGFAWIARRAGKRRR